ncbi:putative anti-sigma factor [Pedobacter sp. BAL39]|uniref:FecR family protein n=1 Tax=Pedobacter sp. BAL39 TaxID=391596 RepID=UPI0001559359|nr:FecR family protein [Pedobacter sp. BAL39]EDM34763.1 putative anti-sigma factor [Pedobacter sp. BAL39]
MSQPPLSSEILLQKFIHHESSEGEVRALFQLIGEEKNDAVFIRLLETDMELADLAAADEDDQKRRDQVLLKIKEVIHVIDGRAPVPVNRMNYKWFAVAAVIATMLTGVWLFHDHWKNVDVSQSVVVTKDIPPGKVGATLTLADGRKISLNGAVKGMLVEESGMVVRKSTNGQLEYASTGSGIDPSRLNTLSTANGETYNVRLPDGSLVYLNAASSLTYSMGLNEAGKRIVRLSGEGYFEVAKDRKHPFIVKTGNQEVEVLGTHFNVNSYQDESSIATTLVEGAVKVSANGTQRVIQPGEQSRSNGAGITVGRVNVESVTDWKDGDFNLNRVNFKTAMRKIARWYDVEVIYDPSVPEELESGGWISRSNNLSTVLKSIENTGFVKFRMEGKKLYVFK